MHLDLAVTRVYENGEMIKGLKTKVTSLEQLEVFVNASFAREGFFARRFRIPTSLVDEAKKKGLLDNFNGAYQHYAIDVESFSDSNIALFENESEGVRQVNRYMHGLLPFAEQFGMSDAETQANFLLTPLVEEATRECASRMPYDFGSDGMDNDFYTFGTKLFYIPTEEVSGSPQGIKGFRIVERAGDGLYLWLAYVKPEYRKQGLYSQLLYSAFVYAKEIGCKRISVATDVTENNPMRGILEGKGFYKTESSFISKPNVYH